MPVMSETRAGKAAGRKTPDPATTASASSLSPSAGPGSPAAMLLSLDRERGAIPGSRISEGFMLRPSSLALALDAHEDGDGPSGPRARCKLTALACRPGDRAPPATQARDRAGEVRISGARNPDAIARLVTLAVLCSKNAT